MSAALTPRVRIMVVCDDVIPNEIEDGVFTLENVRQHVSADTFPCFLEFSVFLLLSCPQPGDYPGLLLIRDARAGIIHSQRFPVTIDQVNELNPFFLDMGPFEFTEPGQYAFEVWFLDDSQLYAQKGEQPFFIWHNEE